VLGRYRRYPWQWRWIFSRYPVGTVHRVVVLGKTGSGKSYATSSLFEYLTQTRHLMGLIVDAKDEYGQVPELQPRDLVRDGRIRSHRRRLLTVDVAGEELTDHRVLEFACAVAWARGGTCVYIEEAIQWVPKDSVHLPRSRPLFYRCLQQGRSRRIHLLIVTQMLAQLNLAVLRQATCVLCFAIRPSEARQLERYLSLRPNSLDWSDLPRYSFYWISDREDEAVAMPPIGWSEDRWREWQEKRGAEGEGTVG